MRLQPKKYGIDQCFIEDAKTALEKINTLSCVLLPNFWKLVLYDKRLDLASKNHHCYLPFYVSLLPQKTRQGSRCARYLI